MMHVTSTTGDSKAAEEMAELFGPGQIDNAIRQAIQFCWMALPHERRHVDELDAQVRRIVDRALKDFREDVAAFAKPAAPQEKVP
jgi:hypothetical protein